MQDFAGLAAADIYVQQAFRCVKVGSGMTDRRPRPLIAIGIASAVLESTPPTGVVGDAASAKPRLTYRGRTKPRRSRNETGAQDEARGITRTALRWLRRGVERTGGRMRQSELLSFASGVAQLPTGAFPASGPSGFRSSSDRVPPPQAGSVRDRLQVP